MRRLLLPPLLTSLPLLPLLCLPPPTSALQPPQPSHRTPRNSRSPPSSPRRARNPYRSRDYEPFDEFAPSKERRRDPRYARSSERDASRSSSYPSASSPSTSSSSPTKVWTSEVSGGQASFFSRKSFEALGASSTLVEALRACGASKPSHVQALGFAPILAGEDVVLADQTGSGKTLAYLAPLLQRLRQREETTGRTPPGHVGALVLLPTSELAQQVLSVAKTLSSGGMRFRSAIITGEHKWSTQRKCAKDGVELIVATPGRLGAHLQAEHGPSFSLDSVQTVVLDEADLLFDDPDFDPIWSIVRERLPASTSSAFVTATLSPWVVSNIQNDLPLVKLLKGKTLHKTGAGVKEKLIDCSAGTKQKDADVSQGFERKMAALLKELSEEPVPRTLVFCNTIESCRRVENRLRRADRRAAIFEALPFHGAIPADARKEILNEFRSDSNQGVPKVLVATDRASRGMDFVDVSHVVLFDFPRDGVEYLRRVGRVTRGARTPGRVTSLVLGRQLMYARTLMKINRQGGIIDLEVHGSRGDY